MDGLCFALWSWNRAWYPNFLISLLIVSSFSFSPACSHHRLPTFSPSPSAPLSQSLSFLVLVVLPCHVAAQAGLNYAPLSTSYFSPMASLLFPIIPSHPPSFLVHKYKLKSESGEGNFRRRMLSRGMAFSLLPVRPFLRPSIHDPSKDHRHSMRSSSSVLTSLRREEWSLLIVCFQELFLRK